MKLGLQIKNGLIRGLGVFVWHTKNNFCSELDIAIVSIVIHSWISMIEECLLWVIR